MAINYGLIGGVISIALIICFIMIFFGYRKRAPRILKLFGAEYFTFEIINPARKLQVVNKMVKDFKVHGKVILFASGEHWYRVMEDRLVIRNNRPYSMYKFGNPTPINILDHPDSEIAVYDEDNKTMVKIKMSGQELRDAIESKVVHDLNKFTFSRMEIVMVIVGVVAIIMNIVVVYEITQINSEFGNLINELNQILANLPKSSLPGAT